MSKLYSKSLNFNKPILVIVESPAKCKKIEEYLGSQYKCLASFGHLRELPSLDSIDFHKNYHPTYKIIDQPLKKKQIITLRNTINESSEVILATDDDREGEAIAWHLCQLFDLSVERTKRIVFHEITKDALEYAVKHPIKINMNIVHSAHARQILDLLIGYKISPFLWQHISSEKGLSLSAGRCQTPALRIVYENELERLERLDKFETINEKNTMEKNENALPNVHSSYSYSVIGFFTRLNLQFSLTTLFETKKIIQLERDTKIEHYTILKLLPTCP